MGIKERVYGFKTEHKYGFTWQEIEELLASLFKVRTDNFNKAFNQALGGITVMSNEKGEMIIYPQDVERAIRIGLFGESAGGLWD